MIHAENVLCVGQKRRFARCQRFISAFFNLLFHWLTTDKVTNEFPATQPTDSLMSDYKSMAQWTYFLQFHPLTLPHFFSPTTHRCCFSPPWSASSFGMETLSLESKWHLKVVSCDSCQAIGVLPYYSCRVKLETLLGSTHHFEKISCE